MHIGHSSFAKVEELGHIGVWSSHGACHSRLICHNQTIADAKVQQSEDKYALRMRMELSK